MFVICCRYGSPGKVTKRYKEISEWFFQTHSGMWFIDNVFLYTLTCSVGFPVAGLIVDVDFDIS